VNKLIAIPTAAGRACAHFGRCESFALLQVREGAIVGRADVTPPDHTPGAFPRFLAHQGVEVILAGGMGAKARELFRRSGIDVHVGVIEEEPELVVGRYLAGDLGAGDNACSHGGGDHAHTACRDRT
jgi:predicted Fe-Mo cluster-binding NifX family protein